MIADETLNSLADESPFIFGGETQPGEPVSKTAVVVMDELIRVPEGWKGLAGTRATVRLTEPLAPGRYIFFADPFAVGDELVLQVRALLEAASRSVDERVTAAVHDSYLRLIARRAEAAEVVVLGTLGAVHPLTQGSGRPRGVPWAETPLEVKSVLKGPEKLKSGIVVGPRYATRHLPMRPALHPRLHAIFFLTSPPPEALELLPPKRGESVFFLATAMDIQPPDRLSSIEHALRGKRKK